MRSTYDIVIAGAGPAGGQCARDAAARGYDVVVLETESAEEFPRRSNKSTAGTFPPMLVSFDIPDEVVEHETTRVVLESPNDYYIREYGGAVLDFKAFKQWLVEAARENGAEFRFDSRVNGPIVEDGEIVGVEYNGDQEVYGEIIVDATGPSAALARPLGVTGLERGNQGIAVDYHLGGVDLDCDEYADLTDAMMLRLDHDVAPGGYSWIFHTGEDTAKAGVCYMQDERHEKRAREDTTIDGYFEDWLDTDPRFEDAYQLEDKQVLRGSAHLQMPGTMSTDNFMAIGDTVPSIDPLWGEGIEKCMRSGRTAAITADRCLSLAEPDTSAVNTAQYDTTWHEEVAPNARSRLMLTELLYMMPNGRYDQFMRDLNSHDKETLRRANDGDKRALMKLVRLGDVPYFAKWAADRITDPTRRWNPT